jgi:hypothetical protein
MSSRATFYVQSCPTCGRHLQVCVEYLGRRIQCRHCRAVFVARDPESATSDTDEEDLLHRVDELLALSESAVPLHR